jgi:hypothetical protein
MKCVVQIGEDFDRIIVLVGFKIDRCEYGGFLVEMLEVVLLFIKSFAISYDPFHFILANFINI